MNRIANTALALVAMVSGAIWISSGQDTSDRNIAPGKLALASNTWQEEQIDEHEAASPESAMLIPTANSIARFKEKLTTAPNDTRSIGILARLYIRQAKETDDFEGFVRAEKLLRDSLQRVPNFVSGNILLGEALMAQHRFHEAKQLIEAVLPEIETQPNLIGGLATLGDAEMHLGNYPAAEKAFRKLISGDPSPAILVRLARVKELIGEDSSEVIDLLRRAYEAQRSVSGLPSTESWYAWRLGKALASGGRHNEAKPLFQGAIRLNPDNAAARADFAFTVAVSESPEDAIGLYKEAIACSEEPPFLTALGDLYTKLGQTDLASIVYGRAFDLMEEESKHPLAGPAHARELALFLLNHDRDLPRALTLAESDMKVRKDVYAYDTLAWAQYKNGNYAAAGETIQRALAFGTRDATLYFHAGMIENALGNLPSSIKWMQKAIEQNPKFSILDAEVARRKLAELQAKR